MKAEELRIGNLIQLYRKAEDKEMSIHFVSGIENTPDIGWMIEIEDGFYINVDKGIEPIPLTEEWLVKFGGKKDLYSTIKDYSFGDYSVTIIKDVFKFWIVDSIDAPLDLEIKYVHQLQNLYFALTSEELNIKL